MHAHLISLSLCLVLVADAALAAESPAPKVRVKGLRPAEGAKWTAVPLDGGKADELVAHGKSLYSAADRLYRSDDGGATWSAESLPAEGRVSSLASTGDELWLALDEKRLFRRGKDSAWKELTDGFCHAKSGQKAGADGIGVTCTVDRVVGLGKQAFVDSERGLFRVEGERFTWVARSEAACPAPMALEAGGLLRAGCDLESQLSRWKAGKSSSLESPVQIVSALLATKGRLIVLGSLVERTEDVDEYGPSISANALYVSSDGGKRWSKRATSEELKLLVEAQGAIYGVSEKNVLVTRDEGKSWKVAFAGSCDEPSALVFGSAQSPVLSCKNGLRRWDAKDGTWGRVAGLLAGEPEQFKAAAGALYVQSGDGLLHRCNAAGCRPVADGADRVWLTPQGTLFVETIGREALRISENGGESFADFAFPDGEQPRPEAITGKDGRYVLFEGQRVRRVEGGAFRDLGTPLKAATVGAPVMLGDELFLRVGELFADSGTLVRAAGAGTSFETLLAVEGRKLGAIGGEGRYFYATVQSDDAANPVPALWRSVRVGGKWPEPAPLSTFPKIEGRQYLSLAVRGTQVWALSSDAILESLDRGATWQPLAPNPPGSLEGIAVADGQLFVYQRTGRNQLWRLPLTEVEVEVPAEEPDVAPAPAPAPAAAATATAQKPAPSALILPVSKLAFELPPGARWSAERAVNGDTIADRLVLDGRNFELTFSPVPRKECRQSFRGVSFEGKGAPKGFEKAFDKWKVSSSAWTQMEGTWLWFTCASVGSKDYLFMVSGKSDRTFGGSANAEPLGKMLNVLSDVVR